MLENIKSAYTFKNCIFWYDKEKTITISELKWGALQVKLEKNLINCKISNENYFLQETNAYYI
jgi:hypothetical protein